MEGSSHEPKTPGWPLEVTVFVCGALVMIFEINGSRIVAPFLGNSTYIWTSLIGVILAALSVGYWLGGQAADKKPDARVLSTVLISAGGLVSITILTNEFVLTAVAAIPVGLAMRSLLASVIIFAPASVAFGFVLPFSVKLRTTSLSDSGKTVGRLYALSTVGSIAGTFLAGFILIPFVGSVRTLYIVALCLFVLGVLIAPNVLRQTNIASIVFFLVAVVSSEVLRSYRYRVNRYVDIDTEYSRLSVFDTSDARSQKGIRAISNDPYFLQSAMYLDNDDLVFEYTKFFHIAGAFVPKIRRSLMIGGAGYSFPRDYLRGNPNATIDVVEIDPGITQIALEHFRLEDDPRLKIFHEDARVFMRTATAEGYDVIYMDAFGTLFSVPTHLTTVEFLQSLEKKLDDDGALIMNLGGALTGDGSGFFRAEIATLRLVFPEVRVFKVDASKRDDEMQNLIIVATKNGAPGRIETTDAKLRALLDNEHREPVELTLPPLTDDLAPVEYYNSIAQSRYVRERED